MITKKKLDKIKKIVDLFVGKDRMKHIVGTAKFAETLAKVHGLDTTVAQFLGYAHDLFRDFSEDRLVRMANVFGLKVTPEDREFPILLHGKLAAEYVRLKFNISDDDILDAIRYHTSGFKDFGVYGKLLFLADSLEETRNYPNVSYLREIAFKDLDMAFFEVMKNKLIYALSRNLLILNESIECWNYLIRKRKGGLL
ncbi:metal-dependent phosphohydrolase [Thermosipho melanesiensis]|uniref:Metal dependent phosphohydrolase n=2 Tax=Thermosipho melanesiensis TaxID=46541 RepID=A6LJK1_THEM4|nr:bis(5'-nucleosyl)-tetraphosphatase (symmetrical) YqeK [Thermosipho melanesiensis]ABR30102.1 metal dependent phosphohydrolase [Thermosipho melanesiensis BI429]APT73299.1 metal-dependent phosphohydrolase [Thermosipho melanesiensis]OOC38690.1 metal-dependent phosphohydrolase [Thermosipho melanesiensis]OOC40494.1 metal-dependent phosphohydrolase [Thermosipho melanesiensis]OOC40759.1 metal-dependent phosphohydrolase [Thermosipho melanesiensis]